MLEYDFNSAQGIQNFQNWVNRTIQNEINSYARQVLGISNAGVGSSSATSSSSTGSAGDSIVPSGTVMSFAGGTGVTAPAKTAFPEGWLLCDGSQYTISSYGNLFDVIK